MASKYDWEFIQPLNQTANIAALSQGNQQINAGLQGMGNAVTGYADAMKQRNTDDILNTLMGAQSSAELPNALSAVQSLQQQYGRGYDQTAVRNAIDTRGSTLGARDLQNINLQQAQAAQAAIPQLNQAAIAQAKSRGMTDEQLQAYQNLGIDASGQINSATNNTVSDIRDARDYKYREGVDTRNYNHQVQRDLVSDDHWKSDNDFKIDESNFQRGFKIAAENPGSNKLVLQDGKWVTVNTPKISGLDAYGVLSGVRGIRNNNPGNIDFHGQAGATRENGKGRFASFNTPEEGLAAMSKQLDRYASGATTGKKLQTVSDIVSTWAPDKGKDKNNTKAYIASVAKKLGISPDAQLNLADSNTKTALMSAMISHENGGNPYTAEQYAAGVLGSSTSSNNSGKALAAVNVPQAAAAKAVGGYNTAITDLQNKFNLETTQNQGKTSLGSGGQTIDSWLTSKPVSDREGSTLITNYSNKVAKLARNNPKLSNLPVDEQLKILDASHAWALAPGGAITDKELNKHITNLADGIIRNKKDVLEQSKKNIFESQYQAFNADLNKAGQTGLDRDAFRALVSPTKSKPTSVVQQPTKAAPVVRETDNPFMEPTSNAQAATQAVQDVAPKKAEVPSYIINGAKINAHKGLDVMKTFASAQAAAAAAAKPTVAAKAPQPKPTKEAVVDFMVKRGAHLFPNGLDATKDKTLIREAAVEARKRIAQNELSAKEAKRAESEKRRKYFLDREAAKIEAERKKLKEEAEKRKPGVKLTFGSNHLTQKQLDEMFDKYKSR